MSNALKDVNTFLEQKAAEMEAKKTTRVVKRYNIITLPFGLIFGILWGMGVIVAKGFWLTLAAFFVPFIGPAVSVMWLLDRFTGA